MLEQLTLTNYPGQLGPTELLAHGPQQRHPFLMKTCQRTLVLAYGWDPSANCREEQKLRLNGKEAYNYLLEVICGLKSQLVGENEIVGQFKSAYKEYVKMPTVDTQLLRIIEKLFKDAKTIRSSYLLGLSQKTYASIARKQVFTRKNADRVLIIGSGQLSEDLINQFKKKTQVFVCARNHEKVARLKLEHGVESVDWVDLDQIKRFAFIVNSIGFDGTLFDNTFFDDWITKFSSRLFIDLGSPSILETDYGIDEGIMHLQDIFHAGAIHESHKKQQIKHAKEAVAKIAQRRSELFRQKLLLSDKVANKVHAQYV